MIQPPFPSTIGAQRRHVTFLTTKTAVRKTRKTTVRRGPVLGQAGACAGGGGGYAPMLRDSLSLGRARRSAQFFPAQPAPQPSPSLPSLGTGAVHDLPVSHTRHRAFGRNATGKGLLSQHTLRKSTGMCQGTTHQTPQSCLNATTCFQSLEKGADLQFSGQRGVQLLVSKVHPPPLFPSAPRAREGTCAQAHAQSLFRPAAVRNTQAGEAPESPTEG